MRRSPRRAHGLSLICLLDDSARLANIKLGGAGLPSPSDSSPAQTQTQKQNSDLANNVPSADLGLIGLAVMYVLPVALDPEPATF